MSSPSVRSFVEASLPGVRVEGARVLEIGALDVNGSSRAALAELGPAFYLGVDLRLGPGVDLVCSIDEAPARLGPASFEVVICTEVLEHVPDWRSALGAMKAMLAPGGILVLTTRSPGFPLHEFPHDHWRFTVADLSAALADLDDVVVEDDPGAPGVFARGTQPGRAQAPASLDAIHPAPAPGTGRGPAPRNGAPRGGAPTAGDRPPGRSGPGGGSRTVRRAGRLGATVADVLRPGGTGRLRADARDASAILLGFDERLHRRPDAGLLAGQAFGFRSRQRARWVGGRSATVEPWFEPARPLRAPAVPPPAAAADLAPTFVGIGAPKCGTTWWYELLAAHPRYRSPRGHTKELLYFDQFLVRPFGTADAERYRAHFRRPPDELLGEWSPVYLEQPWAAAALAEAVPEARLLVMVRDPVERALSDLRMQYARYGHDLHTRDVSAAADRSRYALALRPWLAAFRPDQVLVLQYERCCRQPEVELARTWVHLGVEDPCPPEPTVSAVDHCFHPGTMAVSPVLRGRLEDMLGDDSRRLVEQFGPDLDAACWPWLDR